MSTSKIKVEEHSDGFLFFDKTGPYSSSNNTDGYGGPNPKVTDYTKAIAKAKSPSGNEYAINISGDFPRIDKETAFLIRPEFIDGKMEPGVWTFWMELYDADDKIHKSGTYKVLAMHVVKCCVDKLQNKIDFRLIKGNEYQKKIALLSIALTAAKKAETCQRWTDAQNIIETVYKNCLCDCCF